MRKNQLPLLFTRRAVLGLSVLLPWLCGPQHSVADTVQVLVGNPPPPASARPSRQRERLQAFERADKNGDGYLDPREWAAMRPARRTRATRKLAKSR